MLGQILSLTTRLGGVVAVLLGRLAVKKSARRRITCLGILLRAPFLPRILRLPGRRALSNGLIDHAVCRFLLRLSRSPLERFLVFYEGTCPLLLDYLVVLARTRNLGSGRELGETWEAAHESGAKQVGALLNELGGFYLKVGQVFATKQDLLPAQYTKELKLLFDGCKPSSEKHIIRTLEEEFGRKMVQLELKDFDARAPLASATIAQVHSATTAWEGATARVAVKIQHEGVEKLMESDISNMLAFVSFLENKLKINFSVDQTSILREYREIVPQEFDFGREGEPQSETIPPHISTSPLRTDPLSLPPSPSLFCARAVGLLIPVRNLTRISRSLESAGMGDRVVTPRALGHLCTKRVITMTFLEGPTFSKIIHQQEKMQEGEEDREINLDGFKPKLLLGHLIESYGQQIFVEEVFHSDPHPGNLVWLKNDRLGLIDFGECKELHREAVILLAKITVALARGNREMIADCLDAAGVIVEGVARDYKATVATIIFDTRMDLPEAHLSPFDDHAEEMRMVNVSKVPEEYFMVIRVVTLLRGMNSAFACDLSAAQIWEPFARRALERYGVTLTEEERTLMGADSNNPPQTGGGSPLFRRVSSIFRDMRVVVAWMKKNDLPHDRQTLTPLAIQNVTTIRSLAALAMREPDTSAILDAALARFTKDDQGRLKALAIEEERESIWREQARIKEQGLLDGAPAVVASVGKKKKRGLKSKLAGYFLRPATV